MTKPEKFEIDGPVPFSGVCGSLDTDGVIDIEVWNENASYSGSEGIAFLTLTPDQAEALANWLLSAAVYRRDAASSEKAD
jgi:hypothetical protein